MSKLILITGASSGFGKAIAERFAREGWNCIITGRRQERLKELAKNLQSLYGSEVLALPFDVRDKEAVLKNLSSLPDSWQQIDLLVNNAGLAAGRDNFEDCQTDDWEAMIDTNIKGLLYVTKAIVPYLIKRNKGQIINIGSIAGKEVYPMGNVYNATKHAVNSLSQSLRMELLPHKIKVTAIHPGAADTEFSQVRFKGNEEKSAAVYEGYEPLHAADIADIAYYCATLPPHVCINDLVVTCTAQANSYLTFKNH